MQEKNRLVMLPDSVKEAALYCFQPIVGGIFKNPFVVVAHTQAGAPGLPLLEVLNSIYQGPKGSLEFMRGYWAHAAKVLPTNLCSNAYIQWIKDQESIPSHIKFPVQTIGAGIVESLGGAYQENLEFKKNIVPKTIAETGTRYCAMIVPSISRNSIYWTGSILGSDHSAQIKETHGTLAGEACKIGYSVATAISTTPLHVYVGQSWSRATCNPAATLGPVIKESGATGLMAGVVPRIGVIGICVFFNMTALEWLKSFRQPPALTEHDPGTEHRRINHSHQDSSRPR